MNQSLFNYSWRIGRLWDTDIRVHWSLPLVLMFFITRSPLYQGGMVAELLVLVALPWLLLFQSVLLHEFGHIFAARHYHMPASEIILTPIGGLAMIGGHSRSPKIEFVVAAAGPAVNVALFGLGLAIYFVLRGPVHAGLLMPFLTEPQVYQELFARSMAMWVLHDFIQMQAFLVLFNCCVAAYPMDGGRMLMAALWSRMGHGRAMYWSLKLAQGLALLMAAAALWFHMAILLIIAFFIFIQAAITLQQLPHMPDPGYGPDPRFEFLAWQQQEQRTRKSKKIKRAGPIRRWLNRRKARREMKQVERQMNTRQRVDELLDKITREGISSLTEEEKAYLKQASQQYQGSGSNRLP